MNTQTRIVNSLTAIVTLLVFAIGAGAFVLSYDALLATGQTHGTFAPGKIWIFPLLVDAPLVVFTLALLVSQIMRQSAKLWAGLVILYTLTTIGFNLSHAQSTPLGWTVAIVAPIGLLLTTEALRHLAKTIIERQAVVSTLAELSGRLAQMLEMVNYRQAELDTFTRQIDNLSVKRDELAAQIEALRSERQALNFEQISPKLDTLNDARQAKKQERLDTLRTYLLDNPQANLTEGASIVGVSRQTAGEYVKELGLHKNGNGWEVVR